MLFVPHSEKQEQALFSKKDITLITTGIQWGKSETGCLRLKMLMHEHTKPTDNFLLLAPNYKIMQQSSLPIFLRLMEGYGEYKKADANFPMNGGGTCWMRTGTDPDSIVGIQNVRGIWADECGLMSKYFWENIQGRSAFLDAPITLTTSPYSLNWVFKELIKPALAGKREDDLCWVKARSDENPYFPKSVYEKRKKTMDPRRFRMIFGGEFERMEGLVYDVFDDHLNRCQWPEAKDGDYYAGIDWGWTDPFALIVVGVHGEHRIVYSEVKKARKSIGEIIDICKQKQQIFGVKHFYCDPSRPDYIDELNRNRIPASAANNSIKFGIAKVYEAMKSRHLRFVVGQTPQLDDEIEAYHYPSEKDLKPDEDGGDEKPVGQDDHALDALRYVIVSIVDKHLARTPHTPEERRPQNQQERIAALLKRKNDNG